MKRTFIEFVALAVLASLVLATIPKHGVAVVAQAEERDAKRAVDGYGGSCSLARAAGNWSLTDNGTVVGVGSRVAVGVFTLDADGSETNGVATSSLNGTIYDETFSGTITVNSNCTGTWNADIYISGVLAYEFTVNLAFDKNVTHMRGVFVSAVAEPSGAPLSTVIALDANKQ